MASSGGRNPVYAYDWRVNDSRLYPDAGAWEGDITIQGAVSYLKQHVRKSLVNDSQPAYEAYVARPGRGFFALPRILFPYVTFLGTLLKGMDSTGNAVTYMERYFGWPRDICDFVYKVYRHGLAHTNMPKVRSRGKRLAGWEVNFDGSAHLKVSRRGDAFNLAIDPHTLCEEIVRSIDRYCKDLKDGSVSFAKFKQGFLTMARTDDPKVVVPAALRDAP